MIGNVRLVPVPSGLFSPVSEEERRRNLFQTPGTTTDSPGLNCGDAAEYHQGRPGPPTEHSAVGGPPRATAAASDPAAVLGAPREIFKHPAPLSHNSRSTQIRVKSSM